MTDPAGSRPRRRLIVWFVAATIVPAAGLSALGWRMVVQDRALAREAAQARRNQAAEFAAEALQRVIAELERELAAAGAASNSGPGSGKDDAAVLLFDAEGLQARAGAALPYYPAVASPELTGDPRFARADDLEFKRPNLDAARRLLIGLTSADAPTVRAEAWIRLARIARKRGDTTAALAAFDRLISLDAVDVDGWPAGVRGRQGRAIIFAGAGRATDLEREAAALAADLERGRWVLTRTQYAFSDGQAREWLGRRAPAPPDPDRLALAGAGEIVWNAWRATGRAGAPLPHRQTIWSANRSVLALTRASGDGAVVLLAGPGVLERRWRERLRTTAGAEFDFALSDAEGRAVLGEPSAHIENQSVRTPSATQLPWTIHAIDTTDPSAAGLTAPTRLMVTAVCLMVAVVIASGYAVNRAVSREIEVATFQSEFVAAVSHEFRTPLTTLRHLSELLVAGRVSSDQRRSQFYETLLRESRRLHRLVEGLLNFARLESGQLEYRADRFDPAPFLSSVVTEFRDEAALAGYRVELRADPDVPAIAGDRDLLARVVWNLLDNAVKYSPDDRTVQVELSAVPGHVAIRVRDRGLGIPASEQQAIFGKFVRGSAPRGRSIKGTGIGLALAREIVAAHRGRIIVESVPGEGSTFTVELPAGMAPIARSSKREPQPS
jgi:signal transduction histidine kinase